MRKAAEEGIFFNQIVANVTGIEARQICIDLGFSKVIDHPIHKFPEHVGKDVPAEIWEMIVARDGHSFFAFDRELGQIYRNAGLYV